MTSNDDLVERLRLTPLEGPRKNATAEVREWAVAAGIEGSEVDLLARYNDAAKSDAEALRADLRQLATEPAQRTALIGLLARTHTTDSARLAVLEAIAPGVDETDVGQLARVSAKQRPSVLAPTLEVIGSIPSAVSLFSLRKLFGARADELGARARELADELEPVVGLAAALVEGERALENEPPTLAYAAAAADHETLKQLREASMTPLKLRLEEDLAELDADLQERSRAAGSTNEFDSGLRESLYEAVALTGIPSDQDSQARALESIFRRDNLEDVEPLMGHLPASVVTQYVGRALTRANRRGKRSDRAAFALDLLRDADEAVWADARALTLECLEEPDDARRRAAARALARHSGELDAARRRAVANVFAAMDEAAQREAAEDFTPILVAEAHDVDLPTLIRWVHTVAEDELDARVDQLLARWQPRETPSADHRRGSDISG